MIRSRLNPDRMYKNVESGTHFRNPHMFGSGSGFRRTRMSGIRTQIFINFKKNIFNINSKKQRTQRCPRASFIYNHSRNNTFPLLLQLVFIKSNQIIVVVTLTCPPSRLFIIIISLSWRLAHLCVAAVHLGVLATFASRLFIIIISSSCQLRGCSSSNHRVLTCISHGHE